MKNYSNKITEMQSQITEISRWRYLLQEATNLKVQEVLDVHFDPFKEMEIRVSNSTATFHLKDEDGIRKEIFSIYFDDRYGNPADKLRLSYYSTSTNSDFELERLIKLGLVAKRIKERTEEILSEIKEAIQINSERSEELFSIELKYENQIKDYRKEEVIKNKNLIEFYLTTGGVTFSKPVELKFKFKYRLPVTSIKIIDITKSGKTGTAVFTCLSGAVRTEEKVNIQSVISQVTDSYKYIAELEIA